MKILGIDIGGSGIKGCIVDIAKGEMLEDRQRFATPQPATPTAVLATTMRLLEHFNWKGPIGCGFPAVIKEGVVCTAANIDPSWVGANMRDSLVEESGCPVAVLNDADAAGLAEMEFGAGKGINGTVVVVTLGTGIGSAIFCDGHLLPNTEFGFLYMKNGKFGEHWASDAVRKREDLDVAKWGKRVKTYLEQIDRLLWPDLIIIGGGGSKRFKEISPRFRTRTRVVPAALGNHAGIIGAALAAKDLKPKS